MSDRNDSFKKFREDYPEFVYSGYEISESEDTLDIVYRFEIKGLSGFSPKWSIKKPSKPIDTSDKIIRALAFSLGMVELVSYWKITCSPTVTVECGSLDSAQLEWWKKLYKKGLGEFYYRNGIDPEGDYMSIKCTGNENFSGEQKLCPDSGKVIIPIGGGKDSAVTIETLKKSADRYCYIINPRQATLDTAEVSGIDRDKWLIARRTLDKNMLRLNSEGFLNGHTPFSALVAFSSVLTAYMHQIAFVALSNESSANESTVKGSDVNHQYSKSLEFESDFIGYESEYIGSGVSYFSLLRPLTEIGIARIFSRLKPYHPIFRSCNVGSKEDKWCAHCPKCLFVYIVLSPFVEPERLAEIFGDNMLDNPEMLRDFDELVGVTPEKPFECVGSRYEVNAALQSIIKRFEKESRELPALLKHYKTLGEPEYDLDSMCDLFDEDNHVPEKFRGAVKQMMK